MVGHCITLRYVLAWQEMGSAWYVERAQDAGVTVRVRVTKMDRT
jgi:hypothetical protein